MRDGGLAELDGVKIEDDRLAGEKAGRAAGPFVQFRQPIAPTKGTGDDSESLHDASINHREPQNIAEQGEIANIKQNTTNKGYFHGRRMK